MAKTVIKLGFFLSLQWTPLHIAAREGHEHTLESIVVNGAAIDVKNDVGVSATNTGSRFVLLIRVSRLQVGSPKGQNLWSCDDQKGYSSEDLQHISKKKTYFAITIPPTY